MALAERQARQANRKARRARIVATVRTKVRSLDEDDKEALLRLLKRSAEMISDGEISAEDVAEFKELVADLEEARKNT